MKHCGTVPCRESPDGGTDDLGYCWCICEMCTYSDEMMSEAALLAGKEVEPDGGPMH